MIAYSSLALFLGFAMDLNLGDPQGLPHITRVMGALIRGLEGILYPLQNKRFAGALLVIIICLLCLLAPAALLFGAWLVSPWLYLTLETLIIWQCLAVKSLRIESGKVYTALRNKDLPAARYALSMIVGRDTENLDEAGITRACVETVAENTSDGVIAPLFYIVFFGSPGGCLYKAINTMDSMIGYKNERYIDFGRAAAKLDDFFNFIPSRLCALLMVATASQGGLNSKNAWRIWRRDRRKHASPNAAQTESVMAGALGVRLSGSAYYGGVLHDKPYIGDDARPIETEDIIHSHKLLYRTAFLMFIIALVIRVLTGFIWAYCITQTTLFYAGLWGLYG